MTELNSYTIIIFFVPPILGAVALFGYILFFKD